MHTESFTASVLETQIVAETQRHYTVILQPPVDCKLISNLTLGLDLHWMSQRKESAYFNNYIIFDIPSSPL